MLMMRVREAESLLQTLYCRVVLSPPSLSPPIAKLIGLLRREWRGASATWWWTSAVAMAMAMRSAITTHGFAVPRDEFNAAAPVPSQPQISLGELAVDALQQLYALAAMQYEWRQFANAAATYERALAIDIGNADAWDSLGLCMRELKDLDGAISCYRNALRFRPNHAHALLVFHGYAIVPPPIRLLRVQVSP